MPSKPAESPCSTLDRSSIGIAKGKFKVPDDIDAHNDQVARLFMGGGA
jgi:hypothetical protein